MACGSNAGSVRVLGPQYISSKVGRIKEVVSPPVVVQGNKIVLAFNLMNWTGTDTLQYEIQLSHDGEKWDIGNQITAFTPASFDEFTDCLVGSVTSAFARMAARLGTTNADSIARFSAALVFSQQ